MTTTYLLRPVARVVAGIISAVCVAGLLSTLSGDGDVPLFFLHLVIVILVAGAAYLLDDSAKQVTDVVPRSLLQRRLVLMLAGFSVLVAGWGALAAMLQWWAPSAPLEALAWESAGLAWMAVAGSAVLARRGDPEPGNLVASAGALLVAGVLVFQPMLHVNVLIDEPTDPVHDGWWTSLIVAAAITLAACSRERRSGRRRSPHQPTSARRLPPTPPPYSSRSALTNGDRP